MQVGDARSNHRSDFYDYDNLLLSYADRARVTTAEFKALVRPNNGTLPSAVLVDGFANATWSVNKGSLRVTALKKPSRRQIDSIVREGLQLLTLLAPNETHDVQFL